MSIRQQALMCVGRPVVVHTQDGSHYGVLHHVDDSGLYLRRTGQPGLASLQADTAVDCNLLPTSPDEADAQEAWFPFLFIPWLLAAAVYPWGWWW